MADTTKLDLSRSSRTTTQLLGYRIHIPWIDRLSFSLLYLRSEGSRPDLQTVLLGLSNTRLLFSATVVTRHCQPPIDPDRRSLRCSTMKSFIQEGFSCTGFLANFVEIRFCSLYWRLNGTLCTAFWIVYEILLLERRVKIVRHCGRLQSRAWVMWWIIRGVFTCDFQASNL